MAIVYYYAPMSSAVRTTWAIEELGLPCERRLIDLGAKGAREAWFLEKNLGWLQFLGIDYSGWQNIEAWAERCHSRPAHQRSMAT